MYQTTQALSGALASGACGLKLTAGSRSWQVHSAQVVSDCCGGEQLTIGAVCSARLTASLAGQGPPAGTEVRLGALVETGQDTAELPLGTFTVTELEQEEDAAVLTAYDAAYTALGGDYAPTGAPATAKAVLADIAAQCGLTLGDLSALTDQSVSGDLTGYTCREMAGYMAALLGCNALIDRDGRLALRWFTDTGRAITPGLYYAGALKLEDQQTLVGLRMVQKTTASAMDSDGIVTETETTTTYSAGIGTGLVMEVENPFASQEAANAVWTRLSALGTFRTGSCTIFGGLELEPGDLVHITDLEGGVWAFPVASMTLELDGGCKAALAARGKSETALNAGVQGPTSRLLSRLQADLGAFKELTADNFNAAVAKVDNLYADAAWVNNLFAGLVRTERVYIGGNVVQTSIAGGDVLDGTDTEYVSSTACAAIAEAQETPGNYGAEWGLTGIGIRLQKGAATAATPNLFFTLYGNDSSFITVDASVCGWDNPEYIFDLSDYAGDRTDFWVLEGLSYGYTVTSGLSGDTNPAMAGATVSWRLYYSGPSSGELIVNGAISEGGRPLYEKYAPISHTHACLPLTGGTVSGNLAVTGALREGTGTVAGSANQTVLGKYNVADNSNAYALIIGNGTYDQNRSNALTVDWSGNIRCAGNRVRPNIALRGMIASTTVNANSTLYHEFDFTSILSGYPSDASWFPYQVNHQSYDRVVTTNWWTSGKKVCVWYRNVTGSNASGNAQCSIVIIY